MIEMSADDCGYGDGEDDACEEVHLFQFVWWKSAEVKRSNWSDDELCGAAMLPVLG